MSIVAAIDIDAVHILWRERPSAQRKVATVLHVHIATLSDASEVADSDIFKYAETQFAVWGSCLDLGS